MLCSGVSKGQMHPVMQRTRGQATSSRMWTVGCGTWMKAVFSMAISGTISMSCWHAIISSSCGVTLSRRGGGRAIADSRKEVTKNCRPSVNLADLEARARDASRPSSGLIAGLNSDQLLPNDIDDNNEQDICRRRSTLAHHLSRSSASYPRPPHPLFIIDPFHVQHADEASHRVRQKEQTSC